MTITYYGNVNPDLLRWIPLDAADVLELGCGEAALAAAYRERNPRVRYTAVESHPPAAAVARTRVDRLIDRPFHELTAEELADLGQFDAVVLGDVLEHLPDPWDALRKLADRLRPDGVLALSVPNVGHWTALASLFSGQWPAADGGLFDRTHLRWFTLASLRAIIGDVGLDTVRARPRVFPGNKEQAARWLPVLGETAERMGIAKDDFLSRAQTLQYVVSAARRDRPQPEPERLHVHFAAITPSFLDARMRLPFEALQSVADLTVSYAEKSAQLPKLPADQPKVAVIQRLALTSREVVHRFVQAADEGGWVLAFEIDDHPELIGQVQRSDVGRNLAETLTGCAGVQTSTERLAEALRAYHPEVAVFRNGLERLPPALERAGPARIFHGALNREGFTRQVAEALGNLGQRHPEAKVVVVHDRAFFDALRTERKTFHPAASYAQYLELMGGCDIVLSPLEGAPSEQFKSDIKFLEAAAGGAAMLASRAVYADTLRDGETGLLADGLADWPRLLDRLLADAPLRRRLGDAARRYVAGERMLAYTVADRVAWYRRLWREREALRSAAWRRLQAPPRPAG